MIQPISNNKSIEIPKQQGKRDETFSEILYHERAIVIEQVKTPEGRVLYDREASESFRKYMYHMANAHGVKADKLRRILGDDN